MKQRHGDPCQRPLQKGELSRVKRHVRGLIEGRDNAAEVWKKLTESFEALKADALARSRQTGVHFRWEKAAERDIYEACCAAGAEEVVLATLAVAYLAAADPRRFASDTAMFAAAGRKIRLLSPANFTSALSPSTGKVHRTPRDINPRRLLHIGTRLLKTFGGAGLALHAEEVAATKKAEETTSALTRAITA